MKIMRSLQILLTRYNVTQSIQLGIASLLILAGVVVLSNTALAEPKFNAPRAYEEPRWNSQIFMRGADKTENDAIPVLERDYRPLHVYGNMQRRHHYRGTVVPSHRDRTDMRDAFQGHPIDRYR